MKSPNFDVDSKNCGLVIFSRVFLILLKGLSVQNTMPEDPEKVAWRGVVARCTRPHSCAYSEYGGRGVKVCERWLNSYKLFLEDVGLRPGVGYSLDRIDGEGNYEPGNVRWATLKEQNRNQRSNRKLCYAGQSLTVSEWAEQLGVPDGRLRNRLNAGLPTEDVLKEGRVPQQTGLKRGPQRYRGSGLSKRPEYAAWKAMMLRCTNPKHPAWKNYGGRGIQVCERWTDLLNFLADIGERPSPNHSLERIHVNGNYEPSNCRWATRKEQSRNTRSTRLLTHQGETLSLIQWAECIDVGYETLRSRLRGGWDLERALTPHLL